MKFTHFSDVLKMVKASYHPTGGHAKQFDPDVEMTLIVESSIFLIDKSWTALGDEQLIRRGPSP